MAETGIDSGVARRGLFVLVGRHGPGNESKPPCPSLRRASVWGPKRPPPSLYGYEM